METIVRISSQDRLASNTKASCLRTELSMRAREQADYSTIMFIVCSNEYLLTASI
jgi:hypothetical protein